MQALSHDLVLTLVLLIGSSGCTLVGAQIGSEAPRFETHAAAGGTWLREVRAGEEIGIRRRHPTHELVDPASPWSTGVYERLEEGAVVLSTAGSEERIALEDVAEVRTRRGSQWVTGALLGAVIDALLIGFVVASQRGDIAAHFDSSHVNSGVTAR